MNPESFKLTYAAEERRDYIARATIGTFVSIPLNLFCTFMDRHMYPELWRDLFSARLISVTVTALVWLWYRAPVGRKYPHWGCAWYLSPLVMILWMIYYVNDGYSFYYAGLNIVIVGMGLLTPWAYLQNLIATIFVVGMYLFVSLVLLTPNSLSYIMNNATFLLLTGVLVVTLDRQNKELADTIQKLTEAESQLVQSEKMASLGRMSAGIIHEINNPLNFATTGIFTLKKKAKHVAPNNRRNTTKFSKTWKTASRG
jgi:two-component system sensor histidine kinase PhcS